MKQKNSYGWVMVFLGFMVMAVVFVSAFSVNSLFVVPVCDDFGIGRSALSMYLTVSNVATLLIVPLIGKLMGKYGARRIGTFCIALLGISIAALSFAPNIYVFYVIAVFRGIGYSGATTMLVNTIINSWFGPKKKGTVTGIAMIGSSVGGFIIMPIITQVISAFGWQWGYRALGILVLAIMIPLMLIFAVDSPAKLGLSKIGEAEGNATPALAGLTTAEAQKTGAFWLIFIGFLLMICTTGALSSHAVAYLSECGLSSAQASSVQSTGLLFMAVGKVVIGRVNDKCSGKAAIVFGCVCMIVCYLTMFAVSMSPMVVPVYMVFYALGQAIGLMAPTIMISNVFGNKGFAGIMGFITMANGIGNAAGPLLLGSVYDITGDYNLGWIMLAVIGALSFLLIMLGMRRDYRQLQVA